jgi:transposase
MTAQTQYNYSIIGIDVAKNKLDIYFFDTEVSKSIANTPVAIKKLVKDISKKYSLPLVVMESTGGYEKLAQILFNEANCGVHVAHPTRIHYFAKQKGFFAKTDSIDAKIIAQYGMQEQVQPTLAPSKQAIELKELSSRRSQLIEALTAEKCRVKDHQSIALNKSIKHHVKYLENQIKLLDEKIAKIISADKILNEKSKRAQTLKGIG